MFLCILLSWCFTERIARLFFFLPLSVSVSLALPLSSSPSHPPPVPLFLSHAPPPTPFTSVAHSYVHVSRLLDSLFLCRQNLVVSTELSSVNTMVQCRRTFAVSTQSWRETEKEGEEEEEEGEQKQQEREKRHLTGQTHPDKTR